MNRPLQIRNTAIRNRSVFEKIDHNAASECVVPVQISRDEIQMVAKLNNRGVSCIERADFAQARKFFKRSLDKASELSLFIMPHVIPQKKIKKIRNNIELNENYEYEEGMNSNSKPMMVSTKIEEKETSNGTTACTSISRSIVTILFNLGILYLRLKDDEEATKYFSQALDIAQQQQNHEEKSSCVASKGKRMGVKIITILHNIGYIQYRSGYYEDAEKTYKKALRSALCKNSSKSSELDIAVTLNCLGVVKYRTIEKNSGCIKAADVLQESLAIQRTVLGSASDHDKDYATTLNNLGRVYYIDGNYENAFEVYAQAQKIRREVLGDDHLDVAAIAYNMGQTLQQCDNGNDNFHGAIENYKKFLAIMKNHRGVEHQRNVGNALGCMANIYHEQKDYAKAAQMYKRSLFVGKAILGQFHEEIANTLNKLGNLHYETGDYEDALSAYKQGLEIEREVLDGTHPNIVVTLTNIGKIYKIRGEYEDALLVHQEALKIQRESLGQSHPDVCSTLLSVAAIHYDTHKYESALKTYERVLRIQRDACGDIHLDVASTLISIGLVLFKMEFHEYALHAFEESLMIRKKLLGPDHRSVAIILYNIGAVYLEISDNETALSYYNETLRVEREALGNDHEDVALTLEHVGYVYQQRGEINEAIMYFLDALEIYKRHSQSAKDIQSKRDSYLSIAQALNNVGNLYLQKGQTQDMVATFSEAIRYLRKSGKSDDELTICGLNYYGLSKMHPECASIA